MTVTAVISIDDTVQESGTLGAFVGTEVRGEQSSATSPAFGAYVGKKLYVLTAHGVTDGEVLSFKFHYDNDVVELAETVSFTANGNEGDLVAAFELTGGWYASPSPPPGAPAGPATSGDGALPPSQPVSIHTSRVEVTTTVNVANAANALATASTLSAGIFASAAALSRALLDGGVSDASVVSLEAPEPQSMSDGVVTIVHPTTYRVVSSFAADRGVSGYGESTKAIGAIVATEAIVPISDVSVVVDLIANMVIAEINVANAASAVSMASRLSAGMFASTSVLSMSLLAD